ncbi:hypothetical protein Taro_025149, partial [Colocasia esculenta]|nr:hypothetical protein [Colocasia esculenta]
MLGTIRDSGPSSLTRTYNSNTGVRVSRSDDTDLDGTTQVLGQSPELTTWLTKNLGHATGEVTTVGVILLATRTYNSNTRVRVSRLDDTDFDGTTQVPGQSPELTAWLTKNLGHATGE